MSPDLDLPKAAYAPPLGLLAAVIAIGAAMGSWPAALPTVGGIVLPLAGVGLFVLIAVAVRYIAPSGTHPVSLVVLLAGIAMLVLGAYGYWQFLIEALESLQGAALALLAGTLAVVAGVTDWYQISPTKLGKQLRSGMLAGILGFGGLAAMLVWANVLVVVGILALGRELAELELIVISSISLGLGTASIAVLYIYLSGHDWSFVDLTWPSGRDIAWMVAGTIGLFVALIVVGQMLEQLQAPIPEHDFVGVAREGDPRILLLLIPASLLIIGPGEELLFRNIVQKSLYQYFSKPAAVLLASIFFGLAHIPAYGASVDAAGPVLVVFTLSLVLGGIYVRTKNIVVPAIIHGVYNAILFAGLYVELTMDETLASLLLTLV